MQFYHQPDTWLSRWRLPRCSTGCQTEYVVTLESEGAAFIGRLNHLRSDYKQRANTGEASKTTMRASRSRKSCPSLDEILGRPFPGFEMKRRPFSFEELEGLVTQGRGRDWRSALQSVKAVST